VKTFFVVPGIRMISSSLEKQRRRTAVGEESDPWPEASRVEECVGLESREVGDGS
jgi:hypothetical protein